MSRRLDTSPASHARSDPQVTNASQDSETLVPPSRQPIPKDARVLADKYSCKATESTEIRGRTRGEGRQLWDLSTGGLEVRDIRLNLIGAPADASGVAESAPARVADNRRARSSTTRLLLRDVVVVASSSRGGSSVLAETLRNARELLHIRGEINPLLVCAGFMQGPRSLDSDALDALDLVRNRDSDALFLVDELLARDVGWQTQDLSAPTVLDRFVEDLAFRLSIQWPDEQFDKEEVQHWTALSLEKLVRSDAWPRYRFLDEELFFLVFLQFVRQCHAKVNPYYYDIPSARVAQFFPGLAVPTGPPSERIIEEPPFIVPRPWRLANAGDLARQPLILAAPCNSYRLGFLQKFFPNARVRILHLTRNPAASMNGLYDGWRFRGFHSHAMPELQIAGYSGVVLGGEHWWKFDLPCGWREHVRDPLEAVCAFQWRSAHEAVLRHVDSTGTEYCRVQFEDLVGSPAARRKAFERVSSFLFGDATLVHLASIQTRPVMATVPPRAGRWVARARQVMPFALNPDISSLLERLGYDQDPDTWT